jgi:hypothetical protein
MASSDSAIPVNNLAAALDSPSPPAADGEPATANSSSSTGNKASGGGDAGFGSLSQADKLKMAVMTPITLFCAFFIFYGILAGHASMPGNGVLLLFVFFFVVWVLGMAEGLQIALLEVDAEEMGTIRFFLPGAWKCYERTLGEGMSQWLAGRQVLVIFSVFVVAQITTFSTLVNFPFTDSPLPQAFTDVFISTGLPGALVTVAIGQLAPQLIATSHPLSLLRSAGAWPIVGAALALQRIGITHFAWALVVGMDRLLRRGSTGNAPTASDVEDPPEQPKVAEADAADKEHAGFALDEERDVALQPGCWEGAKYVAMSLVSLFSALIIFYGLGGGYSRFPGSPAFHVVLFLLVVTVLGYLEGLQVALLRFPLLHAPEAFRTARPKVFLQYELTRGTAAMNNFLCGRQVFVIFTVFIVAQLSSFPTLRWLPLVGEIPGWFRTVVFDTGLPGALIVVAVGQLVPQLVGEIHPVAMLSAPCASWVTRAALALQRLGLTHFAVLAALLAKRALSLDGSNTSAHTDDEGQLAANAHHGQHRGVRRKGRYTQLVAKQSREDMARFANHFLTLQDSTVLHDALSVELGVDTPCLGPATPTQGAQEALATAPPMTLASLTPTLAAAQGSLMLQEDALDTVNAESTFGKADAPTRQLPAEWMLPGQAADSSATAGHGTSSKPAPFEQYPSPQRIARMYKKKYGAVPRFLLPPDHEKHVPPHIVAHEMLLKLNAFSAEAFAVRGQEALTDGAAAAAGAKPDHARNKSRTN